MGLRLRQLKEMFEPQYSMFIDNEKAQLLFAQNNAKDVEIEIENSKRQKVDLEKRGNECGITCEKVKDGYGRPCVVRDLSSIVLNETPKYDNRRAVRRQFCEQPISVASL